MIVCSPTSIWRTRVSRVISHKLSYSLGHISKEDLKRVCLDLGEEMTDAELEEIFQKCDPVDGDKISFDSFHSNMLEAVGFGGGPEDKSMKKKGRY